MLGSPLATINGEIDIITDVRREKNNREEGKTGGIDVGHSESFCEVLDSSWEGN